MFAHSICCVPLATLKAYQMLVYIVPQAWHQDRDKTLNHSHFLIQKKKKIPNVFKDIWTSCCSDVM